MAAWAEASAALRSVWVVASVQAWEVAWAVRVLAAAWAEAVAAEHRSQKDWCPLVEAGRAEVVVAWAALALVAAPAALALVVAWAALALVVAWAALTLVVAWAEAVAAGHRSQTDWCPLEEAGRVEAVAVEHWRS